MAQIEAFRGLRYDLGHVGTLSDVVAPPYDVIGPDLQQALYRRHPANVIRLILNRGEMGDDEHKNRYSRAARFLRNWQREGLMQLDPDPAVYVYHQAFTYAGTEFTRRGFMARVRLERFGEGNIFPHEETHAAAKKDRLELMRACRANLSQIFGIYPDPENDSQTILEDAIQGAAPLEATDHLGVVHRLWTVTDVKLVSDLAAMMAAKPLFIADGHHRYETACTYRDELADASPLDSNHPANYVLMMCVSTSDPGMIVLPTHRLFRGLPPLTAADLQGRLARCFELTAAGQSVDAAGRVWQAVEAESQQGMLGLYTQADDRWTLARINAAGQQRMAELAADHSGQWQELGVSILQRLIIEDLLGARDLPTPKYVHLVEEVVHALNNSDPADGPFPLAALVMPASLEHIRTISQHGERMPAKSTYFYPKLLSGLVINPLE
jgi:uncharacterized protein (DUF1015 family)